jgi:hypothetical protein
MFTGKVPSLFACPEPACERKGIEGSACTLARWQAILFPERNCLGTLPENALLAGFLT